MRDAAFEEWVHAQAREYQAAGSPLSSQAIQLADFAWQAATERAAKIAEDCGQQEYDKGSQGDQASQWIAVAIRGERNK